MLAKTVTDSEAGNGSPVSESDNWDLVSVIKHGNCDSMETVTGESRISQALPKIRRLRDGPERSQPTQHSHPHRTEHWIGDIHFCECGHTEDYHGRKEHCPTCRCGKAVRSTTHRVSASATNQQLQLRFKEKVTKP